MTQFFESADLEQLFRNIYNSDIDLYVFSKDLEGKFTFFNNKLLSRLGVRSERDILGKTDYDFFDKKLADEYRAEDHPEHDRLLKQPWCHATYSAHARQNRSSLKAPKQTC